MSYKATCGFTPVVGITEKIVVEKNLSCKNQHLPMAAKLINQQFNPYASKFSAMITVDLTKLAKDKEIVLSLLNAGLRHANSMRPTFKLREDYQQAYWSLVYYNDFVLTSCLDPKTIVLCSPTFTELSPNKRSLNILIQPPKIPEPVVLQLVDEAVKELGATLTLRSLRMYEPSEAQYRLVEAYVALKPGGDFFGPDYGGVTVPVTGDRIKVVA